MTKSVLAATILALGATAHAANYECKMGTERVVRVELTQVNGLDYISFDDGVEIVKGFPTVTKQVSSGELIYTLENAVGAFHFFYPEIYTPRDMFGTCQEITP